MGYFKNMHTPWESVGSYEDDELKEMRQMKFQNGVLVPWSESNPEKPQHKQSAPTSGSHKVPCHGCGKPTWFKPNAFMGIQECRECRKANMEKFYRR